MSFQDPDAFYAALSKLLERDDIDGTAVLLRLVLILANEVGETAKLDAALDLAQLD